MFNAPKNSLREEAFAKINLGLWILGKREDGYHEVVTFLHEISLKDDLWLWEDREFSLSVKGFKIEGNNVVERVIRRLKEKLSLSREIGISIFKRIPPGSGLGGGSADAAATIRGALKIWGVSLSKREIQDIASEIGSDVPFFLEGGFCLCRGRGEKVEGIGFTLDSGLKVLLVFPKFSLLTKEVYSWVDPPYSNCPEVERLVKAFEVGDWEFLRYNLKNDLEKPVFERYPELKHVKEVLAKKGALLSLMSGSGSVVFGIFDGLPEHLEEIRRELKKEYQILLAGFRGKNG